MLKVVSICMHAGVCIQCFRLSCLRVTHVMITAGLISCVFILLLRLVLSFPEKAGCACTRTLLCMCQRRGSSSWRQWCGWESRLEMHLVYMHLVHTCLTFLKICSGDRKLFTDPLSLCTASVDKIPKLCVCVTERYSVVFSDLEMGRSCPSTHSHLSRAVIVSCCWANVRLYRGLFCAEVIVCGNHQRKIKQLCVCLPVFSVDHQLCLSSLGDIFEWLLSAFKVWF